MNKAVKRKLAGALSAVLVTSITLPAGVSAQTLENKAGVRPFAEILAMLTAGDGQLDKDNLEDGKYTVDITMQNINRNQLSMANNAVEHQVNLEVVQGKYYVTLDFKGMEIKLGNTSFFGYLKELSYYADGYSFGQYGAVVGERLPAEVLSTQKNADGSDVADSYNDADKNNQADYLYPDLLRFELVPTAIADPDGYAALHVFVPVMDAVTAGSGDQDVLMQVDWSTLKAVEEGGGEEVTVDKAVLGAKLTDAKALVAQTDKYTAESLAALQDAIDAAQAVYDSEGAAQAMVDTQVTALQKAIDNLKESEKPAADKTALAAKLEEAQAITADAYTEASYKALQDAIAAAQTVMDQADAVQTQVDAQITALEQAMAALTEKPLDVDNLADGVYILNGDMVKVDRTTASMSDNAINHNVKLTVKDGQYSVSLDFKGLTINTQLGYLGKMSYYKTGYTVDTYGNPVGETAPVTVESYQLNADGTKVSDSFGTDYPDVVSFELIPEAKADGWVPLQVYVPIMAAISEPTGTQNVYLKLDWSTIEKTTADDPGFTDDNTPGTGSTGTGTGAGSGLGTGSLNKNSLGGASGLNKNSTAAAKKNAATGIAGRHSEAAAAVLGAAALAGCGVLAVKKRKESEEK